MSEKAIRKLKLEKTKSNKPAIWERGGGFSNTGYSEIVATDKGEKPVATYIKRRGELACKKHALIIPRIGYFLVSADHHRGDFTIRIEKFAKIFEEEGEWYAEMEEIAVYEDGEWDKEPPSFLKSAIKAAMEKSERYHCREPYFVVEKKKPIV